MTRGPAVNVAVCGIFHYRNVVRHLHDAGVLKKFYYSHRISTDAETLGITIDEAENLWPKEYLVVAQERAFRGAGRALLHPLFHALWERMLLSRWVRADLFHVLLHGTARAAIRKAGDEGALVLGEPVNAHPRFLAALLADEHRRLGIDPPSGLAGSPRIAEEVAACHGLLVGSKWLKRSFVAEGFPADRVAVIPYGVDKSCFEGSPRPASDDRARPFRVICVASLTPRKGHVYLLEAWKRLRLRNAELVFVGSRDRVMDKILAPFEGLFSYWGCIPHIELPSVYGASDLFVLPSVEDGFGYVCAEALACGVPVIVSENAGAADLVQNGVNGYVVEVRSALQLAERIGTLYEDRRRLLRMREEAVLSSRRSLLSWEEYAQHLVALYAKTLDRRSSLGGGGLGASAQESIVTEAV